MCVRVCARVCEVERVREEQGGIHPKMGLGRGGRERGVVRISQCLTLLA